MFLLFSSKFGHACKGSLSSLSDFILHRICSNLSMFIVKDQRIPDGWSVWLSGCDACEQPRGPGFEFGLWRRWSPAGEPLHFEVCHCCAPELQMLRLLEL